MNKIYCKIPKQTYATEFLRKCFIVFYNGITGKFVRTYHDEAFNNQQCGVARRTFEDLYCIVKTYYPSYTKRNLAKMLNTLNIKDNIFPMWCNAQDKVVFIRKNSSSNDRAFEHYMEHDDHSDKGNGGYSLNDIKKLMK